MALTQVTGPYPIFTDLDGSPLDDGYLFIGSANQDPETNPIQVFWDSNLTIPATQPIRTNNGYAWRNGTPGLLYTAGEFSITIRNKRNEFVLYSPVGYGFDPAAVAAAVTKNDFTGDGVEVDFVLSTSPSTPLATNIYINGVYQEKDSYTVVGNTVTFSVAPPLSSSIEVMTTETGVINVGNANTTSYTLSAPGAVGQTVQTKLQQYVSVKDFGAVGDGVTDDTAAMLAFFNHCISTGANGHISAGSYLITAGSLVFDTPFVDAEWPQITTDGYEAVTFLRADATDAPMITFTNGTATSSAGKYWQGGSLGGITFNQNGQVKAANQHAISMRGLFGTSFGWMRANDQGGSCIYMPEFLYGGTNPDPYANTFLSFEAIEANRCDRYALENKNWVGFNGCNIQNLRVIECLLGGLYGFGSQNSVGSVSMGSIKGWAFDDGTASANTGGSPSQFYVKGAELDDVQYGIRLNKTQISTFNAVRFIHRYNFNPAINPSEGYWPRTAISIGGGVGPNISQITINALHRIDAGGTKPDLGEFVDCNNAGGNILGTDIDQRVFDNAGFGINNSDLYTNVDQNSQILLTLNRVPINDLRVKVGALVRATTADTVPNTGFATAASKINYSNVIYDKGGYYSTANSWFTVPYTGLYRVAGKFCLNVAIGTWVRMAFATDTAGAIALKLNKYAYQSAANPQHYSIDGVISLTAGQRVFLMADQNTAGAVNLVTPISSEADLTWSIEAL